MFERCRCPGNKYWFEAALGDCAREWDKVSHRLSILSHLNYLKYPPTISFPHLCCKMCGNSQSVKVNTNQPLFVYVSQELPFWCVLLVSALSFVCFGISFSMHFGYYPMNRFKGCTKTHSLCIVKSFFFTCAVPRVHCTVCTYAAWHVERLFM